MTERLSGFVALIAVILLVGFSSLYVIENLEDKNSNLKGQLVQKNEENSLLKQDLVITDATVASLQEENAALNVTLSQRTKEMVLETIRLNQELTTQRETFQSQVTALQQEKVLSQGLQKENATLRAQDNQFKQDLDAKETAFAKVRGELEVGIEHSITFNYIATQALSALSTFLPEGQTMVVHHPVSGIGSTYFTYKGSQRGFDIEMYQPWFQGMRSTTPQNTNQWGWGIFPGAKVEVVSLPKR